ncbi:hypothetical protein GF325_01320 [Candidatus Bathyarchaeota archaeon]|nr:hypothetical protein [Candidatus Bathyarchaeota archaeon]
MQKQRYSGWFSKLSKSARVLAITCTCISLFLGPYAGFFLHAMNDYNQIARDLDPPDPHTFIPANYSRLHAMAMWFEDNIARYHMPHNMIVNTLFDSSTSVGNPIGYSMTGDSAEWTGHYLVGEACRYATHVREGNFTWAQEALDNITQALNGFDKILHVAPNGGMARYAWPLDEYPGHVRDNIYLGTWNGEYYLYEDDTSRDMHNGVIMGLGMTYLLVENETIRATVRRLVDDMLTNLMTQGWLYVNPEGDPNGTDLDVGYSLFGTGGFWTLAYLKVGELVMPGKYGPLYQEYAIDRDYLHRSNYPRLSRTNLVQAYYGLLLDWEIMFILTLLESEPALNAMMIEHVRKMHDLTKHDRTAIFHAMRMVLEGRNRFNEPANSTIIGDIEDCLMRYHGAPQRLPGRNYGVNNSDLVSPVSERWVSFFTNGTGSILYPFWKSIYQFEIVTSTALTPDKRGATDFLWSRSPYSIGGPGSGKMEGTGSDYTVVYWLCRYYNITAPPPDFGASINVTYGGS